MEIYLLCRVCGCEGTVDTETLATEWLEHGCPNCRSPLERVAEFPPSDRTQPYLVTETA